MMYVAVPAATIYRFFDHPLSIWNYIAAGIGAALIFYLLALITDGLGGGDVKLILFVGLMLGVVLTILTILIMFTIGHIATIILSIRKTNGIKILTNASIYLISTMGVFWMLLLGFTGYLLHFSILVLGAFEFVIGLNIFAIILVLSNRTGKTVIPLGPFICLGAVIAKVSGDKLIHGILANVL